MAYAQKLGFVFPRTDESI